MGVSSWLTFFNTLICMLVNPPCIYSPRGAKMSWTDVLPLCPNDPFTMGGLLHPILSAHLCLHPPPRPLQIHFRQLLPLTQTIHLVPFLHLPPPYLAWPSLPCSALFDMVLLSKNGSPKIEWMKRLLMWDVWLLMACWKVSSNVSTSILCCWAVEHQANIYPHPSDYCESKIYFLDKVFSYAVFLVHLAYAYE